eukprot:TRINITY_DN15560_c0_g1_i1.p1 TRINITY_DN15560_c0_g1~~TRINITY_DN15560_c0_g1_i1.p1  ORF type:complete len:556 (-),score=77.54 TRINITY_DN15560_c0_g1_i1:63-1730(-)
MLQPSRRCLALLDGMAVAADPVSRLSPFALARLASRAARENRKSVSFWRAVAARASAVASQMQPTDMSTTLFAFSLMRFRDRAMMATFAEACPPIAGQFRAQDITFLLAAFARLDVHHRLVMNLFAREIARKLHDFSAAQLGEVVYSYSRLGQRHDLLFDIMKKRIVEVIKALKPWHMAMIVNGFARLGVSDERFFTILAAEICRRMPEFSGRPLALVANAFARIGVRNRFLLELVGQEAFRLRGELEPQSVAMVLNSHARLRFENPILFDFFAQDVPRRIKTFSLHSLCLVTSAFARHRRSDEALFQKVGDFACENALSLYPRAVAILVYSFSIADVRHSTLFFNAPKHVAEHLALYTTDELAMVARAYGHFQMVHLPLFDTITGALPSRVLFIAEEIEKETKKGSAGDKDEDEHSFRDEPPPEDPSKRPPRISLLIAFLEAYARLTVYEAGVLELLCDAILHRRDELAPALVVQVARAMAALSFAHQGLIAESARCLALEEEGAGHADGLTTEDLESLRQSLEVLTTPEGNFAPVALLPRPSRKVPTERASLP